MQKKHRVHFWSYTFIDNRQNSDVSVTSVAFTLTKALVVHMRFADCFIE